MRLLYVAPNIRLPGTNGGSTHVTEVVRALRKHHDVLVIARRGSTAPGVVPIGLGTAPGMLAYVLAGLHFARVLRAARAFAPDAIYERFSAQGLGVLLGRALGTPVLSMVLDSDAKLLTLEGADQLITTAPHLLDERYLDRVEEVSWGANTDVFRPDVDGSEVRRRWGLGDDEVVLGYTGGFYPWHGLETLLEAAALLNAQADDAEPLPRLRYLLVGDGELRPTIESTIVERGLERDVIMAGRVPYAEVPAHIAASDICVAPYNPARHPELQRQGMFFDPLKVFEYLACAKPTIILDSANVRKIVNPGEQAVLFEPGNVEALAAAIRQVLLLPDRGKAMGVAGRTLIESKYSWQAHGDHLGRLFVKLVEERRG